MARKKQKPAPKGSPAWMATFSDLMNLLLCFFVLLFSMSTVDAQKFQQVIASLQSNVSIFNPGDMTISQGDLVGAGVHQIAFLDEYYEQLAGTESIESEDLKEQVSQAGLEESEEMAEDIQGNIEELGLSEIVEVDFDEQCIILNLSGSILFESGKAEVMPEAKGIVEKLSLVLKQYDKNIIEIEGHTDSVPMTGGKYENNNVLSMYRALAVADYVRELTDLDPANIKSSGRGEYIPIADNSTAEGRARNRRVVIKIYNSFAS